MEPMEVWPGVDSAVDERGMLSRDGSNRGLMLGVPGRFRTHSHDINLNANSGKCHDRYLLPSQAWNRPGILTEVGGHSSQNDSLKSIYPLPDVENTENAYAFKGSRNTKISDPKAELVVGNSNPYWGCRSGVRGNEGLNVLRMNPRYMTGVSIEIAGASGVVFEQTDLYPKSINVHNTPKHGPSTPSVRQHHMRPYDISWRREVRARTQSETAEKEAAMKLMDPIDLSSNFVVMDAVNKPTCVKLRRRLLKSRSLENVRVTEDEVLKVPMHEVDSMSSGIQSLHVED